MGVKGGGGGAACQCWVFNGAEMEREKKWGRKEKKGREQKNERRGDKREGRDVCGPREQTALLMLMLAGCRGPF